jgi:type IV secretory pathway VirB10-like protein
VSEPLVSGITDKAPKPPGLLPKHLQSWLIFGLAILMVVIMWLTGAKKTPVSKTNVLGSPLPATADVDGTKIAELQNRIQQLQHEQMVAQNALAQQSHLLGATPSETGSNAQSEPEHTEDAIEAERKKRSYLSLFASNVALTYRKTAPTASVNPEENAPRTDANARGLVSTKIPDLADVVKQLQTNVASAPSLPTTAVPSATASSAETEPTKKEVKTPAAAPAGAPVVVTGKSYVVFEGTVLETVLLNRLDGANSGPIECLLTNDVYSRDRQHLLVPASSKVLGETRRVELLGQTRLAVVFHRLLMPDGYSVSLDEFKGLNQGGDTGLRDQVNNHYLRIFGTSLALGAIGAVSEAGTGGVLTESGTDRLRVGFAESTGQSSAQILGRFLNIPPTVTIREGHRVKVYLSGDLSLPDYNQHQLPSDL